MQVSLGMEGSFFTVTDVGQKHAGKCTVKSTCRSAASTRHDAELPCDRGRALFPDTYSGADKAALASVSVTDSSHQHKRPMARGFQELLTLKGRTRGHDDCRVVGSIHTILMGVIAAEFKLVPSLGLPSSRLPSCHGVIRF